MTPLERVRQLIETRLLDTAYLGVEIIIFATKDDNRHIYVASSDDLYSVENELKRFGYPKTILQPEFGSVYSVDINKSWRTAGIGRYK